MRPPSRPLWMILAISLAAVLLLVIMAYVIAAWGSPEVGSLPFEFRRYLIQFLLVAALGAVVTFLIDYLKTQAERREQERQYRTSTLTSLLQRLDLIYQRVKQTRQRLDLIYLREQQTRQRVGIRPKHRADNADEMWGLRAEQQDLEQLANDIKFHKIMFSKLDHVHKLVGEMEGYLGNVWREYKREFQDAQVSEGSFGLQLTMFIESGETGNSNFSKFSDYYHDARDVLLDLLVPTAAEDGARQRRSSTPASQQTRRAGPGR